MFSYFVFLHILNATTHNKVKANRMKTILTAVTNTMVTIVTRKVSAVGEVVEVKEGKEETEDDGDGDDKVDVGPVAIVTRCMPYKLRPF